MQKYKVGQLSRIMGVTSHTIKHYEKFNLIYPVKDEENNYRYYDMKQCNRLLESRKYRNMGFSLKDITQIMNTCSNQELHKIMHIQRERLEQQIDDLKQQHSLLCNMQMESMEMDQNLNKWYIEKYNTFLFYKQTENTSIIEETHSDDMVAFFMEYVPIAKPTIYISGESFYEEEKNFCWGIAMFYEGETGQYEQDCKIEREGRGFITYLKIKAPYINESSTLLKLIKEKYEEFNDERIKCAYVFQYKIVKEERDEYHYMKVIIPIQ